MQTAINRQDEGTIELTITIPWNKVKEAYDKSFEEALKKVEVEGFRKGKAPKKLAQDKVDEQKVYQKVIQKIIPKFYLQTIKEQEIKPIVSPKIELLKAKEQEDWQFKATVCEKPKIKLGDYKKAVRKLKKEKRTKIWVPGEDKKQKTANKEQKKVTLNEVLEAVLKTAKIKISKILIENQVNQNLANLLDQVQKLGMTVDQYLQAKGKTIEQLKKEYQENAKKTLALEFVLQEIADQEEIKVKDKEIEKLIEKEKDEKVRKQLQTQKYYLASLLRRQKTLDKLLNL